MQAGGFMDIRQRWIGKSRRSGADRRVGIAMLIYKGPEKRQGIDRRNRKKTSLLVVDSSPTHLFYMGMLLKKLKYDVRTSWTAEDALQTLENFSPALVITEADLPRMSGINLLKQMRRDARLKTIPVIIHTADEDPAIRTSCKIEGCSGFFKKPADPDALYRVIQAATEPAPRHTIRIDTSLTVEVGDGASPGGVVRKETGTDMSEDGLYIKTLTPEPANTLVSLKILIPNSQLNVTGIVLYNSRIAGGEHKEPGMAIRFVSISPEDKILLRNFIKQVVTKGLSMPKG